MYCLSCYFASPVGSTFCSRCGRGFGAKICSSGHKSPRGSRYCIVCAKAGNDLSEATNYLAIAWVSRAIGWLLMAWCMLLVVRNPVGFALLFAHGGLWALSAALGASECAVLRAIYRAILWLSVIYLLSFLLPGGAGATCRRGLIHLIGQFFKCTRFVVVGAYRLARLLLEGARKSDQHDRKK